MAPPFADPDAIAGLIDLADAAMPDADLEPSLGSSNDYHGSRTQEFWETGLHHPSLVDCEPDADEETSDQKPWLLLTDAECEARAASEAATRQSRIANARWQAWQNARLDAGLAMVLWTQENQALADAGLPLNGEAGR